MFLRTCSCRLYGLVVMPACLFALATARLPVWAQTTTFNGVEVPGVVINHSPESSGVYLASPSIVILPNGDYVASHDETGPNSTNNSSGVTQVYRSTDRGTTWSSLSTVQGQFWSGMFTLNNALYIAGTSNGALGDFVIRRSIDGGATWTTPTGANNGLLLESQGGFGFHTAPVPIVVQDGRIWRAFEDKGNGGGFANHFRAGMMSAAVGSDLLDASNWDFTNVLVRDKDWLDGTFQGTNIPVPPGGGQGFNGWLEGNAVVDRNGDVVNVLRIDVDRGQPERAAIARVQNTTTLTFDPNNDIVEMSGAAKKFTIRYDAGTDRYWSLANIVTPENQVTTLTPSSIRNIVAVVSSADLTSWQTERVVIEDLSDVNNIGFSYLDWQFDGSDIVAVSRTANPDGLGGANNFHNANFLTFHRVEDILPEPAFAKSTLVTVGGEVVFGSGGYEGETIGILPSTPLIGTYQANDPDGVTVVTGASSISGGPASAFSGSNYLSIDRTASNASGNSWLTSEFSRGIDPEAESFMIEFAVWGTPDTVSFGMSVGGDAADGTSSGTDEVLSSFGYNASLDSLVSFSDSGSLALTNSTAAWIIGEWNSVRYRWDAEAESATLMVNGAATDQIVNQLDNPALITQFHIRANSGTSYLFLDALEDALAGDYNGDGFVSQADLDLVLLNWGVDTDLAGAPTGWDRNLPVGLIAQAELDEVLLNWGDAAGPGVSAVPEPGSIFAVLALLLPSLARRSCSRG